MSLRGFHIVFIVASILLCLFFGWWALSMYHHDQIIGYMVTAIASFISAVALIAYGIYFFRKVALE